MDFVNKLAGQSNTQGSTNQATTDQATTGQSGGFMDKLHGMAGGGPNSEKNEDALDKGVDFVQERVLGQGAQNNENAVEQQKDEFISDQIRNQYKNATGKEFPVADK